MIPAVSGGEAGQTQVSQVGMGRSFTMLKGRQSILAVHDVLVELSARCEQTGAMDHIELFLDSPLNEKKEAYLLLLSQGAALDPARLTADELCGAVVVYQYQPMGWSTGVFVTDDGAGTRTVIAPAGERAEFSIRACEHLLETGAEVALLSYKADADDGARRSALLERAARGQGVTWGTQDREVSTFLKIERTVDETLTHLGKHTRRNLRYYRKRAEAELEAVFHPEAMAAMGEEEMLELDEASTHAAGRTAVQRRWSDARRLQGAFCMGVRAGNGEWLTMLGGRRHHGLTEVDWQMNRSGMDRYSLGTVMRAYLLEHEVELGTERLFFEGGTPHTMRHSLQTEMAADVIAMRRSLRTRLMRQFANVIFPEKNFLRQVLTGDTVRWLGR